MSVHIKYENGKYTLYGTGEPRRFNLLPLALAWLNMRGIVLDQRRIFL